jgi:hypothetical protein
MLSVTSCKLKFKVSYTIMVKYDHGISNNFQLKLDLHERFSE